LRIFGKRRFVVLAFCLLVLFWGSAFSAVKVGLDFSPPVLFAGLRILVGGLAMVMAALLWGESPNLCRDWPVFLVLVLFNAVALTPLCKTYPVGCRRP
jgi:drug/metabolite transporter (DMT)-like permease